MQGLTAPDRFDAELTGIDRSRSSPNHGTRAEGPAWPDCLVLHYTGMKDGRSAVNWLCDPVSQVSSHYVVMEDGAILQLVPEERRAWHAGRSSWNGVKDLNSASIGIEIVNGGHDFGLPVYPDCQIGAVIDLCRDIIGRLGLRPERILAHSDIAPGRKRDPGERFPWERLAAAGVGNWVRAPGPVAGDPLAAGRTGSRVSAFQTALGDYGYGIAATGIYDPQTEVVCQAFQRHFRPGLVDGIADPETQAILDDLLRSLAEPVSPTS